MPVARFVPITYSHRDALEKAVQSKLEALIPCPLGIGIHVVVEDRDEMLETAGMVLRSPETAQAMGFIIFLPPFLAAELRELEPDERHRGGLPHLVRRPKPGHHRRRLADAASAAGCRALVRGLTAVFAPTAVALYRRKVLR